MIVFWIPPDDPIFIILQVNGVLSAGLGFLTRADKATVSRMTAVVKEADGSKAAEDKTIHVSPLNQLQLDMVTKFYQYVQLTKTKAVTDADVMKLTEDDYVVFQGMPTDEKGNVAVTSTLTAVEDSRGKVRWAFVTALHVSTYQKRSKPELSSYPNFGKRSTFDTYKEKVITLLRTEGTEHVI